MTKRLYLIEEKAMTDAMEILQPWYDAYGYDIDWLPPFFQGANNPIPASDLEDTLKKLQTVRDELTHVRTRLISEQHRADTNAKLLAQANQTRDELADEVKRLTEELNHAATP